MRQTQSSRGFMALWAIVVAVTALNAEPAGITKAYNIIEIPLAAAVVQALNANGDAVGYTSDTNQGFTYLNGAVSILAAPVGYSGGVASDINDSGVVIGYGAPFPSQAARWVNGVPQLLGTLGGQASTAEAVNSSGTIVGWAQVEPTSSRFHGYVHQDSVMRSGGLLIGAVFSQFNDINDQSVAVGFCQTTTGNTRAVLLDPDEGLIELGTLGGITSDASAISNAGHVTGRAQTGMPNPATEEGVVRRAFRWHQGKMLDLGTLPGHMESWGQGVNSLGHVVGTSTIPGSSTSLAFLWRDGVMIDLNTLLPPASGWVLRRAVDINDDGVIVGTGTRNGQSRSFVLSPIAPAPSSDLKVEN